MKKYFFFAFFILPSFCWAQSDPNFTLIFETYNVLTPIQLRSLTNSLSHKTVTPFTRRKISRLKKIYLVENKNRQEKLKSLSILKSKIAIKKIYTTGNVKATHIVPSDRNEPAAVNDTYYAWQWALNSNGQTLLHEPYQDGKHFVKMRAPENRTFDVRWKDNFQKLDQLMLRDAVVAVIDYGVDLRHRDLYDNILKSGTLEDKKNCSVYKNESGEEFLTPNPFFDSSDLNEPFPGECMGWNFTTKDEKGNNNPQDDHGHGTHVSSIIAAKIGNNIGISGVSGKIKILPIKALKVPGDGSQCRQKDETIVGLTHRIARAIDFAIYKNVDAINLSFGWPESANNEIIELAIKDAIDAGIPIVAAAGNDNITAPMFPCASKNVICVGASTITGRMAHFSNRGGQVDFVAPGDKILGLFPPYVSQPNYFFDSEMAIMMGTSQAAPFISSFAASIKAHYSNASGPIIEKIYRDLSLSTSPLIDKTYPSTLFGLVQMDKIVNQLSSPSSKPIVVSQFKNLSKVNFEPLYGHFSFSLPIKNYSPTEEKILLRVETNNKGVDFDFPETVLYLQPWKEQSIDVHGIVKDNFQDRKLPIEVTITLRDHTEIFQHVLDLETPLLINNPLAKHWSFVPKDSEINRLIQKRVKKLKTGNWSCISDGQEKDKANADPLLTLRNLHDRLAPPEYYLMEYKGSQTQTDLYFYIFKLKDQKLQTIESPIIVENIKFFDDIFKMDINLDGIPEYVVKSIVEDKASGKFHLQFSYFHQNGQPLISAQESFLYLTEQNATVPTADLRYYQFNSSTHPLDKMIFPILLTRGLISKADQVVPSGRKNSTFSSYSHVGSFQNHIYYFEPQKNGEKWELHERTLTTPQFMEKLKEILFREHIIIPHHRTLPLSYQIEFLNLLPQTSKQIENKNITVIFQVLHKTSRETPGQNHPLYFVANINLDGQFKVFPWIDTKYFLSGNRTQSIIDLSTSLKEQSPKSETTFAAFFSRRRMKMRLLCVEMGEDGVDLLSENTVQQVDPYDPLNSFISTYKTKDGLVSFVQSQDYILAYPHGDPNRSVAKAKINKSQFAPDHEFMEWLAPTFLIDEQNLVKPAFYVDATAFYAGSLYTWVYEKNKLVAPIKYSVTVDQNCLSMQPGFIDGKLSYIVFCPDENGLLTYKID